MVTLPARANRLDCRAQIYPIFSEIFFNESLHQRLYDPRVDPSEEPIFYRDARLSSYDDSDDFESFGIQTRQLLSPIMDDLNLRNMKADNEVMFRESELAKLRDRSSDFNLGQAIKYFGQARVLICCKFYIIAAYRARAASRSGCSNHT